MGLKLQSVSGGSVELNAPVTAASFTQSIPAANGTVMVADMTGTLTISQLSDGTNSTSSTNCIQGSAKAWVSFNGNGVSTIRGSYNISSVTRNSGGVFYINFSKAMPDTNYAATYGIRSAYGDYNSIAVSFADPTTTTFYLCTMQNTSTTIADMASYVWVVFHR